jgi:uncharacterized protein YjbI with pentapeptide repeats
MTECNFSSANFSNAWISETDFAGSDFTGANFDQAAIAAGFENANLTAASFRNAVFFYSPKHLVLTGASTGDADFTGAVFFVHRVVDPSELEDGGFDGAISISSGADLAELDLGSYSPLAVEEMQRSFKVRP